MSSIKRNVYKIVVIGDHHVGKTMMINKLCYDSVPIDYEPTIEDLHTTIVMTEKLEVIDTSPDDDEKVLRRQSLKNADAVVIVYDSQNLSSTFNLDCHIQEIRSVYSWKMVNSIHPVCIVVGVAKNDGLVDLSVIDQGQAIANIWGLDHMSVKLIGTSVRSVFERCIYLIERKREMFVDQSVNTNEDCRCCVIQ